MLRRFSRLFVIKNRFEAYLIIFGLALGAMNRGAGYLVEYPGFFGWTLFLACSGAVFMAGAKILDCLKYERAEKVAPASQERTG